MTLARRAMRVIVPLALLVPIASAPARADLQGDVYKTIGLPVGKVLNGTVLATQVLPGTDKQVVSLTTFFTGKNQEDAVSVRLDVFSRHGERLNPIYRRDFGEEAVGLVGRGELQIIDLDLDGVNEIIVTWEDYRSQLIDRRDGEVIFWQGGAFRSGWSGTLAYDATRAAREVPVERRDRYVREIDFADTMRTRGVTLFLSKTVIAVAGESLPQPKVVQETFPLKERPGEGW